MKLLNDFTHRVVTLQDNGQGFDVDKIFSMDTYRKGFGFSSMRERAELSGGPFTIESIQGKGTTIRASWSAGEGLIL